MLHKDKTKMMMMIMVYKEYKNHTYQTKKKLDDRKFCMNEKKKKIIEPTICYLPSKSKSKAWTNEKKKSKRLLYTTTISFFSLVFGWQKKSYKHRTKGKKFFTFHHNYHSFGLAIWVLMSHTHTHINPKLNDDLNMIVWCCDK